MKVKSENTTKNTSPNPSKGGEQAVRKISVRKQLPLFWRGLGGGASGLLRSARNDAYSLILLLFILFLSSCNSMMMSFYGIKNPQKVLDNEIVSFAEKKISTTENLSKIDSTFVEYINSFSTIVDTNAINDTNQCKSKNRVQKDLQQPIQAMYFDKNGKLISYFTNCYAGGFPNLKWNRDNNFKTFPPKSLANIHNEIVYNEIYSHLKAIKNNGNENEVDYIIIVFWNKFIQRQSLRLINLIQKNAADKNVKIIYVNNDNFFIK